ncbi:hypothetical protein COCMIDRAFT_41455 [Bipolaris oryzae ATCC 44560]|uniref:Nephrocystin 3-like N-terminal domain-containing protein n=1 Tax=Bipolaris oryzae ATCC 44560 TaxID=930090 RepID=W6YRS1_COCMI|nr:uncharacterized protein COCMIDRAFT_41455 [Bipolaris oryzae ATCC 44560]EUC40168.1 hypothetical protein COCMIDRAFT_41455 [Bipolaris oryzae ATCC 44560]
MLFHGDAMTSTTSNIQFGDAVSSVQANNINGDVHIGRHENTLDRLPRAEDAPFNSFAKQHEPACLADTRVDLLQEIHSWADGQDERCIFWLSGLAGTGKSTVARTVADSYSANQRLAASFFFSRGGGDVSHAGMFVTSMAVQLADNIPASRYHIRDAIAERSGIARQSLRDQWHHLILRPLSKLREDRSYILVVDALDECDNDNNIQIIIQLLAEVRPSLTGVRLRVFLTSRPEVPIRHGFGYMADSKHKDVVLHSFSPSVVDHDIGIFLEHWLSIIAKDCHYGDDWPGAETIKQLVQRACGLFIWAATAFRFIQEGGQFAKDRLRIVLKDNTVTDNPSEDSTSSEDSGTGDQFENLPENQLDSMYLTVLKRPIRRYTNYERKKWYTLMKEILGAIVLLYSPLSTISLAQLLLLSTAEVDGTLSELHSILDVPQHPANHVRLHHPSFRDFLLNKDRWRDKNLWVDERQAHTALTEKCILLLSSLLKQDLCGQLEHCIPPEMQYACLYWADHLAKSSILLRDNDKVHEFLKKHYLHWLEALSWMGKINDCPHLHAFVHDMKRFALYNRLPIVLAPLQVYSSALMFAPANSIVKRQFADQLTQWIKSPPQVDDNWSACLQTLEGHKRDIKLVVFSHDSTRLASLSDIGIAKIWDVKSGESSKSHDRTITIWDVSSGACLKTLESHDHLNAPMAFSQNCAWLASGSFNGHNNRVSSVSFSHDSTRLVSASYDRAIKVWDTSDGLCVQSYEGHRKSVTLVAFSHDSTQLVSASLDKTIKIWDVSSSADIDSLACLQTLEGHRGSIQQLVVSHDLARLASASEDNTIKIWNISNGTCLQTLKKQVSPVYEMVFSDDLTRLASLSINKTVNIWDTKSGTCLQILSTCDHYLPSDVFGLPHSEGTATPQQIVQCIINISEDRTWITRHDEEWLWIPVEYRPGHFAISGGCITLTTPQGNKIWRCDFFLMFSNVVIVASKTIYLVYRSLMMTLQWLRS